MIQIFLFGIIFALIGIPCISSISELFSATIGILTTKSYYKMEQIKAMMQELNVDKDYSQTNPIGFTFSLNDSEEAQDEDDE